MPEKDERIALYRIIADCRPNIPLSPIPLRSLFLNDKAPAEPKQ
jgi:hypothetical protein